MISNSLTTGDCQDVSSAYSKSRRIVSAANTRSFHRNSGRSGSVSEQLPPDYVGGGPVVKLSKADGRVLDFYLTQ